MQYGEPDSIRLLRISILIRQWVAIQMDIVLDSNYLTEFLTQYFDDNIANRGHGRFLPQGLISRELARKFNNIMMTSEELLSDLVIASALAFVEIARNWEELVQNRFTIEQLHTFVYQPPIWFDIAPIDNDLLPSFVDVPAVVKIGSKLEPIEWTDGVHMATVLSRGEAANSATLATSDHRLIAVLWEQGRRAL